MESRNWMMLRPINKPIRRDRIYADSECRIPPPSLRIAKIFFALAASGGTLSLQRQEPTGALADKLVDARLSALFNADAHDYLSVGTVARLRTLCGP